MYTILLLLLHRSKSLLLLGGLAYDIFVSKESDIILIISIALLLLTFKICERELQLYYLKL